MKQDKKTATSHCHDFGKLLPQAPELEEAVLGAIMIEKEAISKINLIAEDFYIPKNQTVFKTVQSLANQQKPIDMHTVVEQLRKNGTIDDIGGAYYITLLTAKVSSAAHLEYHALILKQKSTARKLIQMAYSVQSMAFDETVDIADAIELAEREFTAISAETTEAECFDMQEALTETLDYMAQLQVRREKGENTAISTGLQQLNNALNGGWQAPDLIILGGRPSMGKTQLAVHFAKNAGLQGDECLFVSIEMTKIQLIIRMITENEGIDFYRLKTGQLSREEWQLVNEKVGELERLNLSIADSHNVRNLNTIKSLARRQKRKGDLKLLIIDYLQLIETNMKFGTRDLEIGYITRNLKSLAKELNIPIILLAQLNRPTKGAKVEIPRLHDLRESGNIEQDADVVIFPHRPTYYDKEAHDDNGSWENKGFLVIAKHREGAKDDYVMFYHDERFKKIWGEENNGFKPNNYPVGKHLERDRKRR